MSTGLMMMLKSLGIDPKMLEGVAQAVQSAAADLKRIRLQNEEILARLDALETYLTKGVKEKLADVLTIPGNSESCPPHLTTEGVSKNAGRG